MTATIAVHEFISADGVFESPSWTFEFGFDPKMGETLAAITGPTRARSCSADVRTRCSRPRGATGPPRTTRAHRSSTRPRSSSSGRTEPAEEWANTTRLGAYDADAIRRLKEERDGVIYISGSGQLVRGPDPRRARRRGPPVVYPISLGEGERFWAEGEHPGSCSRRTTSTTTGSCTSATGSPEGSGADGGCARGGAGGRRPRPHHRARPCSSAPPSPSKPSCPTPRARPARTPP